MGLIANYGAAYKGNTKDLSNDYDIYGKPIEKVYTEDTEKATEKLLLLQNTITYNPIASGNNYDVDLTLGAKYRIRNIELNAVIIVDAFSALWRLYVNDRLVYEYPTLSSYSFSGTHQLIIDSLNDTITTEDTTITAQIYSTSGCSGGGGVQLNIKIELEDL